MKLFNPFKPHLVVTNNGKYAVRKSEWFFWVYLDKEDSKEWWFIPQHVKKYCLLDTREEAQKVLDTYNKRKEKIISKAL